MECNLTHDIGTARQNYYFMASRIYFEKVSGYISTRGLLTSAKLGFLEPPYILIDLLGSRTCGHVDMWICGYVDM